jgi:hypothetical protein
MQVIIIDEEFKSLLPKLDKNTYASLEANLLENGCRDSLVLWNDILIDGHNRYEICSKHGIPFNTINKEFASREEALIWIISTQVSRRNLTPIQLSHYRGLQYRADKKLITNKSGQNQYMEAVRQHGGQPNNQATAPRLAEQYKVSPRTIERDSKIAGTIDSIGETSPEAKQMILSGEANITKKELEELSSVSKEEIAAIALEIEQGTYEKRKAEPPAPEKPGSPADMVIAGMQPLETIIGNITDGFSSELPKIRNKGDREKLRTALRDFINRLEELYKQL